MTSKLNPHQFHEYFHGTARDLRAGSLIRPASMAGLEGNFPGESDPDYAHATTSASHAGTYADKAVDRAYNRGGRGTRRVYEVKPTGDVERDPRDPHSSYRSAAPWRIARRVPVAEWDR